MHVRVGVGVVFGSWQLQYLSSRRAAGAGACLLAEEALQDGAGRTVGHEVPFFAAEEATWRAAIHLTTGRAIKGWLFTVILVDVAGGCGRRRLSGWWLQQLLRVGRKQRPWRLQVGPRSCEQ